MKVIDLISNTHNTCARAHKYTRQIKVTPPELSGARSARAAETVRPKTFFVLQALKEILPNVIVQGIPSVNRAVINVQEGDSSRPSEEERCGADHTVLSRWQAFLAAKLVESGSVVSDDIQTISCHRVDLFFVVFWTQSLSILHG